MIHNFHYLLKHHINDMCNKAEKKEIYNVANVFQVHK